MTFSSRISSRAWAQLADEIRRSADRRALLGDSPRLDSQAVGERLRRRDLYRQQISKRDSPQPQPSLSVVLGTYNRLKLLKTAIRSIRENRIGVPYEIIVVDGGSTDGTIGWLVKQPDIISIIHHNRIDGVRLRSWGWFMNLALRAAHGKFVAMVSDDCYLYPGAFENGLGAALAGTGEGRRVAGVAFHFRDFPAEEKFYVQHTLGGMLMVNHGIFVRSALERVNFLEEELFDFYKADSDLSLKLWRAGYEIVASPGSFVDNFVDPDEALRIENTSEMKADREMLVELWSPIFYSRLLPEEFKLPFRAESDVDPGALVRPPWSHSRARKTKGRRVSSEPKLQPDG